MSDNNIQISGGGSFGFEVTEGVTSTGRPSLKWRIATLSFVGGGQRRVIEVNTWTGQKQDGTFAGARAAAYNLSQNGPQYLVRQFFTRDITGADWKRLLPIRVIAGQRCYAMEFDVMDPKTGEVLETLRPMVQVDAVRSPYGGAFAIARQVIEHLLVPVWRNTAKAGGAQVDDTAADVIGALPEPDLN